MMKKIYALLFTLVVFSTLTYAKDKLQFEFPNEGWHKVDSSDGIASKKCYVPYNETEKNYTQMLIFSEKIVKNPGLNAMVMMQKQLGKDKNNYRDIIPEYIVNNENNAMVAWCSRLRNTCVVERVFQGQEGIINVTYINKAPHYSQNIFGQWPNILGMVSVYNKDSDSNAKNLIELD